MTNYFTRVTRFVARTPAEQTERKAGRTASPSRPPPPPLKKTTHANMGGSPRPWLPVCICVFDGLG